MPPQAKALHCVVFQSGSNQACNKPDRCADGNTYCVADSEFCGIRDKSEPCTCAGTDYTESECVGKEFACRMPRAFF